MVPGHFLSRNNQCLKSAANHRPYILGILSIVHREKIVEFQEKFCAPISMPRISICLARRYAT